MIFASELRVGNYVKYSEDDSLCKIIAIDELGVAVEFIKTQEITWIELDQFHYIPLKTKILEKIGFDSINFNNADSNVDFTFTNKPQYWIQHHTDVDQYIFYGKSNSIEKPIKYLHQLQNLYYALTGQELTYQP